MKWMGFIVSACIRVSWGTWNLQSRESDNQARFGKHNYPTQLKDLAHTTLKFYLTPKSNQYGLPIITQTCQTLSSEPL